MNTTRMAFSIMILAFSFISSTSAETISKEKPMRIVIEGDGKTVVFTLNDSVAASDLLDQLPLVTKLEDFGGKEKIFYPAKKLRTQGTPLANAKAGTLAYYAPWGDVVLFYEDFGAVSGLYELGKALGGAESIGSLRGSVRVFVTP